MTSAVYGADSLEHGQKYRNQDSFPVVISTKEVVLDSCKICNIPFDALTEAVL
jgi:hypothetical protein